ncbi:hypothetical protein BJX99DRAFT_254459 [Aspergillus californicus]
MSYPLACENQPLPPLRVALDLAVCLVVAGSYIPQLVRIAISNQPSNGISGWYMILLMVSATAHLSARAAGIFTKATYDCIRNGNLSSWQGFSALLMLLQVLVQWICAIILLAVYLAFRHGSSASNPYSPLSAESMEADPEVPYGAFQNLSATRQSAQQLTGSPVYPDTSPPANLVILVIVITHAVVVVPPALYILFNKEPFDGSLGFIIFHQIYFIVLSTTGLLTSIASVIPQVYLMASRFHAGLGLGNLSVLGTGLQVLSFAALCISQCARLWFWHNDRGPPDQPPFTFWMWFASISGPAVSYGVLALVQLVVFCVALGIRGTVGGQSVRL